MLAHILTIALMRFLPLFKEWVKIRIDGHGKKITIQNFNVVDNIIYH
jgi:hypothetical protein